MASDPSVSNAPLSLSIRGSLESMMLGALPLRQFGHAVNWSNYPKHEHLELKPWVELPQADKRIDDTVINTPVSIAQENTAETSYEELDVEEAVPLSQNAAMEDSQSATEPQPSIEEVHHAELPDITTKALPNDEPPEVRLSEVEPKVATHKSVSNDLLGLPRMESVTQSRSEPVPKSKAKQHEEMPTSEYLVKLEQLVLELNMELCGRNDDTKRLDTVERMAQRIIALNLENLALKEELAKSMHQTIPSTEKIDSLRKST